MINADEPLIHGSEDHGCLTSPAVRITVRIVLMQKQRIGFLEERHDRLVGFTLSIFFQDRPPQQGLRHLCFNLQILCMSQAPFVVYWRIDRQPDLHTKPIIFQAVAGGNMDKTRACRVLNKICRVESPRSITEWMLILQRGKLVAIQAANDLIITPLHGLHQTIQQPNRDNVGCIPYLNLGVVQFGIERHCHIGWQCPGSGRPDQHEGVRFPLELELHINTRADVVSVFDFRLGKGRLTRDAPVDGFLSTIDETLVNEIGEEAQFSRFIRLVQGQVGLVPFTQNTQPLELFALEINVFSGVSLTCRTNGSHVIHVRTLLAHLLNHLEFNG